MVSSDRKKLPVPSLNRVAPTLREVILTDVYGGQYIVPDITVFVWHRIPCDEDGEVANAFPLAPDWTIEILSPHQSQTKVTKDILHCLNYGTQMGWLVDPAEKTVFVYRPHPEIAGFDRPEALLPVPSFASELQLTVADLFGWLVL